MSLKLNIVLVYAFSLLFIAANLILFQYDFYYLLLLPPVVLFLYLLIKKPVWIFCFIAFATPLSVQLSEEGNSFSMSMPTEPLIIALLLLLILRFVKLGNIDSQIFKTVLACLVLADFSWLVISSLGSSMPFISFKYVLSKIWYLAVFYFFATYLFKSEKIIRIFLWCFIASTVILSLYTLYQHAEGSFSRDYAYTAMRPFLPDHGMYAAAISFAIPLLYVFARYGSTLNYGLITRVFSAGLFVFLCMAVALSFTRASWLSLAVAGAVYTALLLKIKFRYVLFIALAALAVLSYNFEDIQTDMSRNKSESDDNIEEHLQSVSNVTTDPSNLERLNRWSCAYRMFLDKPILGFGPGTYTFQYGTYQVPNEMTIISTNAGTLGNVHSEYLRPLAESGAPGFIFNLLIVIIASYMGFTQYRYLRGSKRYLSLAVFLGLITYFTHGFLNNYSEFDKIAVPLYGFMAVLTAMQLRFISKTHVEETESE